MKRLVLVSMGLIWVLAKANTYDVSSLNDAGAGTLRQAITDANAHAGPDTITFSTTGKIALSSQLPDITDDSLVIDASSQWSGGIPGDTVDGGGSIPTGLVINADGCVIRGLVIQNFTIGIKIDTGNHNTIGGTGPNHRNIISHNSGDGIYILGDNNRVIGNYIGTDASGNTQAGNTVGITLYGGMNNEIGGSISSERNIISGNSGAGVILQSSSTSDNTIKGNYIGTKTDGASDLGNGGDGILLRNGTRHNKADSNVIAFNNKGIVAKDNATDYNKFTKNSIFDNGGPGIDLGDDGHGVSSGGPNEGIQAPTIDLAEPDTIRGTGPSNSIIEIFKGGSDPSGYGEGKTFITSGIINGSGNFAIGVTGVIAGDTVSATATDMDGNTSEFSHYKRVEEYQPDNLIALKSDFSDSIGADIYNTDGTNQTQAKGVPSNDSAIFYIKIENDGTAQDSFKVKGTSGTGGWTVTYYDSTQAGNDITTDITGLGWYTKPLSSGFSKEIRVIAKPGSTDTLELLILSSSTVDTIKRDAVKAIIYITKGQQPDNQIATKVDGSDYLGDNIYNLNGNNQTQTLSVQPNQTATFYIKMENDGGAQDTFAVKGDSGSGGWDVKYYAQKAGGNNITDSIIAGTWKTSALVPGQFQEIRLEVKPSSSVPPNTTRRILITSTSLVDTTKKDAVKASTEVLPGVEEVSLKGRFRLWLANPSKKRILINYELPKPSYTSLKIYDAAGREVKSLIASYQKPGLYHKVWKAEKVGVYFCYLRAEGFTGIKKIVAVK